MAATTAPHHVTAPDAHLVARAGEGDTAAFGELFRRHAHPAWRLALAVTTDRRAATEAVAEGFTRAIQRAHHEGAPPASFRVSLAMATRKAALSHGIGSNKAADGPPGEPANGLLAMFPSLPERWRSVLWLAEVEGGTVAQAGNVLALSPEATEALAQRATVGLRERFLDGERRSARNGCRDALDDLDNATAHTESCDRCGPVAALLSDRRAALRPLVVVMPAGLEAAANARYERWRFEVRGAERRRLALFRPAPPWAERAVAGAAAAIFALGIVGAVLREGGRTARPPELAAPVGRADGSSLSAGSTEDGTRTLPEPETFTYTPTIVAATPPERRPGVPDGGLPPTAPPPTTTAAAGPGATVDPQTPPAQGAPGPAPESPPPSNSTGVSSGVNLGGTGVGVSVGTDGVGVQIGDTAIGSGANTPDDGQLIDLVTETGGLLPPIDVGAIVDNLLPPLPPLVGG